MNDKFAIQNNIIIKIIKIIILIITIIIIMIIRISIIMSSSFDVVG